MSITKCFSNNKLKNKFDTYMETMDEQTAAIKVINEEYSDISNINNSIRKKIGLLENDLILVSSNIYKLEKVDYKLKSIEILSSNKAKQVFDKGNKNNWDLNKILTELQIPKEQKQLILDKNITDREEIITSLLAENSFVVEVNTAKETQTRHGSKDIEFDANNSVYKYYSDRNIYYQFKHIDDGGGKVEITKEEFDKIYNEKLPNTQHYSNLTVPGGTNYTENEISTPLITPNIKGHAQFSTDNGIGWFRSDETELNVLQKYSKNILISEEEYNNVKQSETNVEEIDDYGETIGINKNRFRKITNNALYFKEKDKYYKTPLNSPKEKTRRILEVQSDLFQKGRDSKDLTGLTEREKEEYNNTYDYENQDEAQEIRDKYDSKVAPKEANQFLQLLNQKGNWVNFFIQSIIQDSVKKGYEKVLFPTGETAAKIEGHQTIADEIKNIDDQLKERKKELEEIKKLEKKLFNINDYDSYDLRRNGINIGNGDKLYKNEDGKVFIVGNRGTTNITEKDASKIDLKSKKITDLNDIIDGLEIKKQEMKTQGLEKLKPIEAFYTNRVTNILNKLYSTSEFTDEFGNTWTEVNLVAEKLKGKDFSILLKEQNDKKTGTVIDSNYLYNKPTSKAKDFKDENLTLNEIQTNLDVIKDKLFGGNLVNTTANQVLRNALANLDLNDTARTLVKSLLTSRATVKFTEINDSTTLGEYESIKREIRLDKRRLGFLNEYATFETVLHEIIHDFTVNAINNPKNDIQREFRDNIKRLYNYYNTLSNKQSENYGFKNEHEFVSEIISNPIFRSHIDSLVLTEKKSMLAEIWDYIKSLLGIKGMTNSNEIINTIMEFVNTKQELHSPLEKNYVLQKRETKNKYSEKFTKELSSLDKVLKKIISDIDSVSSKSAAVRGKDNDSTKRFKEIQKLINEFADKSVNEAIYKFAEFANNELSKLNHSLDNKIKADSVTSDYLFRAKSYSAIYESLEDIRITLEDQKAKGLIEQDEYDKLFKELDSAKRNYDKFNIKHTNEAKEIITAKLAPFNEMPLVRRKRELDREYNSLNPGNKNKAQKEKWINDKINSELDSLEIQKNEQTRKLMDEIPMDLQSMETMLTSEKNLNSLIIKLYSTLVSKEELNIRKEALRLRFESFKNLKEYNPTGINNAEKYKKILSKDSEGNHYFLSKYSPEFLRLRKELASKRDKAFEEFGKNSKEYKEANATLKKWTSENTVKTEDGISLKPSDKWLDKDFKNLSGKDLTYHNYIIKQIKEADVKTLGFKSLIIDYMGAEFIKLPSIRKTDLDRLMSGDGTGIVKDKIADFYKPTQDTTGMGERPDVEKPTSEEFVRALTTVNNEERFLVPIHFRNKITPDTQSLDIPTIILMNSVMSEEFRGKHSLEADSQLLLDIVGKADVYQTQAVSRKFITSIFSKNQENPDKIRIPGTDSNVYKKLKSVIENRVYNILDASNNKMSQDNVTVIAKSVMGYTAHLNLAVNYLSAIPNLFQGKFQNFIESVGGTTYSSKDVIWAEKTYWSEMTANGGMKDIGTPINESKINLLIDYLDVLTDFSMKKHDFEKNNKFKALMNSNSLHAFNSMGEHYIQSTLMLSVMSNIKALDKDGNYVDKQGNSTKDKSKGINLYEAIEIKDGIPQFHPKVVSTSFNPTQTLDENGLIQIKELISKKVIDLHGQYDSKIQSMLQRYWYGKAITMFRKYLLPGFYRRVRGAYYFRKSTDDLLENQEYFSLETLQFEEGMYTTAARFFTKTVLKGIKELKLEIITSDWNNLSDYEKSNIHKTTRELALTGLMYVATMITAAAAKDEDDEDLRNLLFTMAYIFRRQESELMQYYNPSDTLKIFRTPFVALSTLEKTANLFYQLMPMNISDQYKAGENKGEFKAWIKTKKLIPVVSQSERSAEKSFNYLQNLLSN